MKIKLFKHGWLHQKYHSCIVAKNGEIIYQSETVHNEQDMLDTVKLITECKEWKIEKTY